MKKILISLMAIALVIGLVGAGTVAYFSDTETSTGNTFTAGIMNLADPSDAVWTLSTAAPGDSTGAQTLTLSLTSSSINPNHLELDFDVASYSDGTPVDSDFSSNTQAQFLQQLLITNAVYTGPIGTADNIFADETGANIYVDPNTDGVAAASMNDLIVYGVIDDITDAPTTTTSATLVMTVTFDANAGNAFQGDSATITIEAAIAQVADQDILS